MNKKIHFTESQINEICDKLNETDVNGPINLTQDCFPKGTTIKGAFDATKEIALTNPKGATFNGTPVNQTTNTFNAANEYTKTAKQAADGVIGESYTKKQLKEAKLRYLKEHSTSYSKNDFKNKFIKK